MHASKTMEMGSTKSLIEPYQETLTDPETGQIALFKIKNCTV